MSNFFHHAHGFNASGQFYGSGGHQTINHNYYYPSQYTDRDQPIDQPLPRQSPIASHKNLIQSRSAVHANLSYTAHFPDIYHLISNVISLIDHDKASCTYEGLKPELELLEQTLVATGLGIQAFRCTQIGHCLVGIINPMLAQCVDLLQDLFNSVDIYRQNLSLTSIYYLWHRVWRWGCEVDELLLWRKKLFACRSSLGKVVMALHSIEWTLLGNELLTGHIFKDFRDCVKWGTRSLHGIQLCQVLVTNHLGDNMPVPTMFCSTQSSFHFIINSYCKNRPGARYVENGQYQVIRSHDSQVIEPLDFIAVLPGMHLEMSIVLRQRTTYQANQGRCPRCRRMNSTVTANAGWIDCWGCPARFSVVEVDEDQGGSEQPIGDSIAEREAQTGVDGEAIMSPASQPRGSNANDTSDTQAPPQVDDETQYFLRMTLLFWHHDGRTEFQQRPAGQVDLNEGVAPRQEASEPPRLPNPNRSLPPGNQRTALGPLRISDAANIFARMRHAREQIKPRSIESSSGDPQTHSSVTAGNMAQKRVPVELNDVFICVGGVDVAKLLRATRASLMDNAQVMGANVLVDERWKCTISEPKKRPNGTFRVLIHYDANATRSLADRQDPHKPVALDQVKGVPGLMTILSRNC